VVQDNPQEFGELEVMNILKFSSKLDQMGVASVNKQHQTSLRSYFQ